MDRYHVLHLIGQGCFGKVYKGRRKYQGQIVALKFISKRGKADKDLQNLRLELGILQRLDHPNIIRLLDSFETQTDFVVVTEFAFGELFEVFQDDKNLPEEEIQPIARQLTQALNYLHSQKIIHRDMKPQNVLIGSNDVIKLCDFGFARVMSVQTVVLTSIKGTPLYMAPELVQERPYDCSADLWSLGVICYELYVGQPPFFTNSLISLWHLIIETSVKYPDNISPNFRSFLEGLLQKKPKNRLGWPHLLQHPFIEAPLPSPTPTRTPAQRLPRAEPAGTGGQRATAKGKSGYPAPAAAAVVAAAAHKGDEVFAAAHACMDFFIEVNAAAPSARGLDKISAATLEPLSLLGTKLLKVYADLLADGMLVADAPAEHRHGLVLSLLGEPMSQGAAIALSLSALLRGLGHVLNSSTLPPVVMSSWLASSAFPTQLIRITRMLCGIHQTVHARGPMEDLLSDVLRILGLWLRAPIALCMTGFAQEELLQPAGLLIQFCLCAPRLVSGGVMGDFTQQHVRSSPTGSIHHLGVAMNSMKCLGLVFTHLSQAAAAHPPSAFVTQLFQALGDLGHTGGAHRTAVVPEATQAVTRSVQAACHCIVLRSAPGGVGERLVRASLQAVAALLHPTSTNPARVGFPWAGDAGWSVPETVELHAAMHGVRENVHASLRMAVTDAQICVRGYGEVDDAILAMIWDLRATVGATERLDAPALKVAMGLLGASGETAKRYACLQAVADSLQPDVSRGVGNVMSAVQAAADQTTTAMWPGVGLLVAALITSARQWGELPHQSLEVLGMPSTEVSRSPTPAWCHVHVLAGLSARMQEVLTKPLECVVPILCACYTLELVATVVAVLFHRGGSQPELVQLVHSMQGVVMVVLDSVVKGRVARQCLDESRKAESALHGYLTRGPLDGVLMMACAQHVLESGRGGPVPTSSLAWRVLQFVLATEDPKAVLAVVGPRGLFRLVDLLYSFRDTIERQQPLLPTLHFCLAVLWALTSTGVLPHTNILDLPHLAAAFRASIDLVLRELGAASQGQLPSGAPEVHSEFQNFQTVQLVIQFLSMIPKVEPRDWQGGGEIWWRSIAAGMQILSSLVLQHHALAHEFVQHNGLQLITDRRLLSGSLAVADASSGHIVVDSLLIVSQLSRLSKDYYPLLIRLGVCSTLRELLRCPSANIRAKTCNALGNMARHSDAFYQEIRREDLVVGLVPLCGDVDSACRKFASFALGNLAFHSDILYRDLAIALPQLLRLLRDDDEKTRANAAGAIGNLVRNSGELCSAMIREGMLQGLFDLVNSRRPTDVADVSVLAAFVADSSVKIALFSLGNLAVHGDCRSELTSKLHTVELCHAIVALCPREEMIHKYAQRLMQKLTH